MGSVESVHGACACACVDGMWESCSMYLLQILYLILGAVFPITGLGGVFGVYTCIYISTGKVKVDM